MTHGRFITLDGVDGAGKSTHLAYVAERLREQGREVVVTREPGGTPLGEELRELLLHREMDADTELLLMFAARQEHIARLIRPALERGAWVVSDRFTDASYAYQYGGRGLDIKRIAALEDWVQRGFQPDLTLLFDVPPDIAAARRLTAREADRFEREADSFFNRVRAAYLERARAEPARIRVLDARLSVADIQREIGALLQTLA